MRRAAIAALALVLATGAKCRREENAPDAALPVPAALAQSHDERFDAVADAFRKDDFDARKLDVLDVKKKAVLPLDVESKFLRAIAARLDDESRKLVADRFARDDLTKQRD